MTDRANYKLAEAADPEEPCAGCALADYCDSVALAIGNDEYMICAEEEDFANYENPIYIKTDNEDEEETSIG